MGLIDADELREYMEKHCEFCKRCLRIYEYLQGRCELCPMSQVYALIDPEAGLKTQFWRNDFDRNYPCDSSNARNEEAMG